MSLYSILDHEPLSEPTLILALTGWVDAGSAGTAAAETIAGEGQVVVEFDTDALFDYRANRPVLRFDDGRLEQITWPRLDIRRAPTGDREVLVMKGNEPDFRWRELSAALADLSRSWQVDRLVTLGKRGDLHARRRALSVIKDTGLVEKLFSTLAERYATRPGGYPRVLRAGFRYGDSAPMALIELVDRDPGAKGLDSGPKPSEEGEAAAAA